MNKIHYALARIFLPTVSPFFSEKIRKLHVTTATQAQHLRQHHLRPHLNGDCY